MKRFYTIITLVILLVYSISSCRSSVQNSTENNDGLPAQAENTWLINILSDIETYKSEEPSNRFDMVMLKNEVEHVQLVISTDSDDTLAIERIGNDDVIDFQCRKIARYEKMTDVLVPCNGNVVPEGNLVKVLLTLKAGTDAKAGDYKEIIRFKNADSEYSVALSVKVVDATIPEVPTLPSVFGINPDNLILSGLDQEQKRAKRKEVSDLLLDYRISPYFCTWLNGTMKTECISSPYSWNDYRTWEYFKDPRFNMIALPMHNLTDSELEVMMNKVDSEGLMDKVYFYIWDEPTLTAEYEQIHQMADRIHKYAPQAKVLTSFFRGPKDGEFKEDLFAVFDILNEATSIYCTGVWSLQGKEEMSEKCKSKLRPGQEWWCYVCMADTPGLANNSAGVPNRVVMWRHWKEQTSGFLYWVVNSFESMEPLKSGAQYPEGDGALVYPGEPYGVDCPCVSIRLERWRDGAEDYELLCMYEQKHGREAAAQLLSSVYQNSADYSKDVAAIESFKKALVEGILK